MPLVFVHGVNVRYDPGNDPHVVARDALFRRFALSRLVADPRSSTILNPYWGDVAATFPWNHGGLPVGSFEAFGGDDLAAASVLNEAAQSGNLDPANPQELDLDRVLIATATRSFPSAVDALWAAAATDLPRDLGVPLAELAARTAAYADANPAPPWVADVADDEAFAARLVEEVMQDSPAPSTVAPAAAPAGVEAFGLDDVRDHLRGAVGKIREAVLRTRDDVVAAAGRGADFARQRVDGLLLRVRTPVHQTVITFLGDAFTYFRQRESHRTEIAERVSTDLEEASRIRDKTSEKLTVVAHSMGGNIVYDLLTSQLADLQVDTFVTVGSQVAVLEELKMFASSDASIPNPGQKKVERPGNVARWINVFDTVDILGFAVGRVFDGVEDFRFGTGHAWAHSGYFVEPMFHQRLGERLGSA